MSHATFDFLLPQDPAEWQASMLDMDGGVLELEQARISFVHFGLRFKCPRARGGAKITWKRSKNKQVQ